MLCFCPKSGNVGHTKKVMQRTWTLKTTLYNPHLINVALTLLDMFRAVNYPTRFGNTELISKGECKGDSTRAIQ